MTSRFQLDPHRTELVGLVDVASVVGHSNLRTAAHQQLSGGDSTASSPGHCHPPSPHVKTRNPHKTVTFASFPVVTHRSFKVVRLNKAKMMATMTNRAITFGSLHPLNSKW